MREKMNLTDRARALRKNMTEAEKRLWKHLRNRQLGEHKFYRQYPIAPYYVDFLCREKKLVIEVDGGQHESQREHDEIRTKYLEGRGYHVFRLWNNDVLANTEGCLLKIETLLNSLTPALSLQGEGGRRGQL